MATVSSHILDTVSGGSAVGVRVEMFKLEGDKRIGLFDVFASDEGRVVEEVDVSADAAKIEYELIFHGSRYFEEKSVLDNNASNQRVVVLRFSMADKHKRYHMPIMLSPHSYSVWWSK
jgi:5-hydroxyisourate hydrolase